MIIHRERQILALIILDRNYIFHKQVRSLRIYQFRPSQKVFVQFCQHTNIKKLHSIPEGSLCYHLSEKHRQELIAPVAT